MSHYDYERSQELAKDENPFASLIMAAMRRADSTNLEALKVGFPEIWDELQERYNAPGGRLRGERLEVRWRSIDPQHQAEDLRTSLELTLAEGLLDEQDVQRSIGALDDKGPQGVLRDLVERHPLAAGLICRFHLEAKTSLMGDADVVQVHAFKNLGLSVGDIGWPNSILKWDHHDAAPEDPDRDARLAAAIEAWKTEHEND